MSKSACVPSRWILALLTLLSAFASPFAAVAEPRVSESYGKLPLHFEANQGQTHQNVRFLARGPGYGLYLTAGEAVLVLAQPKPGRQRDRRGPLERRAAKAPAQLFALRVHLVGAEPDPRASGIEELPGKANYFIGDDPAQWRTAVPTYAKVHYRDVYPGIDLVYYGNQRQLEYDFVVAPGADPEKIALGFEGADKLEIDAQGDLVLHVTERAIRQHKPVIYQEVNGIRHEIDGGYVLKGAEQVSFKVAAYDRSRPLIIDPVVLAYSTYLGGSISDGGLAIAVDVYGNAYVTGDATSISFPTTPGAFHRSFGGGDGLSGTGDAFVTKLDSTGSTLVYSTYIGGSSGDEGSGITVDADGNAYVTGTTFSGNFPTTAGAFQSTGGNPGSGNAFVTKLNSNGSGLVYSTYLGGSGTDQGFGIAVDADRNAYVTGTTFSGNFPTTAGAVQSTVGNPGDGNAFVTKLNSNGSGLVYSTYLGGSGSDYGHGIAVDADGNAYVTGTTDSGNFPTTTRAFQPTLSGSSDAFVTKLDPTGSALVYSTYLGGSDSDWGYGIAVDADRDAFVTGTTFSGNFPTAARAFQPTLSGSSDAFVTKLDPTGSALVYSTHLGGSGGEVGYGIAVDADCSAYVTGATRSIDFPTTPGAFQSTPGDSGGFGDAFVTKLHATGSALVYSSFLGGSGGEGGYGIAVDAAGNAYVAGGTSSTNFPTTAGAFQTTLSGSYDAFVAKITDEVQTSTPSTPFTGTPIAIPGSFEAEDFDRGGEGVAYHDNTPGNQGGQYRPNEDVDIIVSSDSAGGNYVVNNFETGEWLAYTVNVATSGNYDIELRAATRFDFPNSAYHLEVDGVNLTGTVVLPTTNNDPNRGWNNFQWLGKKTVFLGAGQHVLKIVSDQQYFNLNSVRLLPFTTTRYEESAARYTGTWTSYGSETGTFSGGTILASNEMGASATFNFTGTALTWIGVKCSLCGIATVTIDGGAPTLVSTAAPASSNLTSEPVFSASGLAEGVSHTVVITVTGITAILSALPSGGTYIAVDAFDVTR